MWILTSPFWPSDIWFSRQVFLVTFGLVRISADCLIWKHMSKCSTFTSTCSYSSRLDCGKPTGNMVIYKPCHTSAFIIAVFVYYKASHPCDDVALQCDCGHQTEDEWSWFSWKKKKKIIRILVIFVCVEKHVRVECTVKPLIISVTCPQFIFKELGLLFDYNEWKICLTKAFYS